MISASSSNWLDRLRSSRGFPTGSELDLDRFLSSSSSGSVPTTESATHSESTQSTRLRREKIIVSPPEWTPPVSGLLSDLFNMGVGETSRTFSKKSSRKQPNPRFFCSGPSSENELPSSSDDLRREKNQNQNQSSGDNSLNERLENNVIRVDELRKVDDNNNNGGEEEDVDLKTYSRNEVTVIDTSCEEWKSDKWVFRKNDDWKIREKKSKSKSRVFGGKKRKLLVSNLGDNKLQENDDDDKLKMKKKEDEILLQLNKGQPQNVKEREPNQEREDILGKVPQKRFPCPRPPKKFINEGSPVILLKSIPSSNTNAAIKPCKSFPKKRPKKMKII